MSIDDPAMQDALAKYNFRLAKRGRRNRVLSGFAMCVGAALSWGLATTTAITVLADPKVAADFNSGTHTRNVGAAGLASAICAFLGLLLLIAAVWRGPSLTRWIGGLMLLLGGVPLLPLACFAFVLSR